MTEEQKLMWDLLSKPYPIDRTCWNCIHIVCSTAKYPCNKCYGEIKWRWSGEEVEPTFPAPWSTIDD